MATSINKNPQVNGYCLLTVEGTVRNDVHLQGLWNVFIVFRKCLWEFRSLTFHVERLIRVAAGLNGDSMQPVRNACNVQA